MSQDTENFEQLRRLLAIKRHEQPPPGYFNDFSRQVILRIRAADRGEAESLFDRLLWEAPWLQRLWNALEAKPILVGACGVAVCSLMLTGILYSDQSEVPPMALVPVAEPATPPAVSLTSLAPSEQPFLAAPAMMESAGPRPVLTAAPMNGTLLDDLRQLKVERTTFTGPIGN